MCATATFRGIMPRVNRVALVLSAFPPKKRQRLQLKGVIARFFRDGSCECKSLSMRGQHSSIGQSKLLCVATTGATTGATTVVMIAATTAVRTIGIDAIGTADVVMTTTVTTTATGGGAIASGVMMTVTMRDHHAGSAATMTMTMMTATTGKETKGAMTIAKIEEMTTARTEKSGVTTTTKTKTTMKMTGAAERRRKIGAAEMIRMKMTEFQGLHL